MTHVCSAFIHKFVVCHELCRIDQYCRNKLKPFAIGMGLHYMVVWSNGSEVVHFRTQLTMNTVPLGFHLSSVWIMMCPLSVFQPCRIWRAHKPCCTLWQDYCFFTFCRYWWVGISVSFSATCITLELGTVKMGSRGTFRAVIWALFGHTQHQLAFTYNTVPMKGVCEFIKTWNHWPLLGILWGAGELRMMAPTSDKVWFNSPKSGDSLNSVDFAVVTSRAFTWIHGNYSQDKLQMNSTVHACRPKFAHKENLFNSPLTGMSHRRDLQMNSSL